MSDKLYIVLFYIGPLVVLVLFQGLLALYRHIKYYRPTETYGSKELRDIEGDKYRKY